MIPALATRLTNVRFSLDAARAAFGPCWVGGVMWCELEGCPGEVVFRRSRTAAHEYILRVRQAHALHTAVWLSEALERLVGTGPEAEPLAPIAVILRIPEQARHLARCLSYRAPAHLALDGDFAFKPGVVVTCVVEVKGLEFDLVALPDAGEGTWPDTAAARRSFSVAVIRTCHCLVLLAHGPWSPLLS